MKKISLLLVLVMMFLCVVSCGQANQTNDLYPERVGLQSVEGLNEQILVKVAKPIEGDVKILYRAKGTEEYTELDRELMLEKDGVYSCYILGLPKGKYDVRVEQGEGDSLATKTVLNVDVEKQDRSGYAHFKREEGIGGYNNDGSVKENAKIIYVSEATKNTVTLDIDGTTYTGLVAILQAKQYMDEPLIIRILDTIYTNRWEGIPPVSTTSTQSDISLSNGLVQQMDFVGGNTPEKCDEEYRWPRELTAEHANDITIEGIGEEAGTYQFGFVFKHCNSIEVRNLTFSKRVYDGVTFSSSAENYLSYGHYWVHNNTFLDGKNDWVEREDDKKGDECVSLRYVHSVTIAYNKFQDAYKGILISSNENESCMNVTLHHNYYKNIFMRLPQVRNTNVHSYNNYFDECSLAVASEMRAYVFSEANYFGDYGEDDQAFWANLAAGTVKSYGDIIEDPVQAFKHMDNIVKDREAFIANSCRPDGKTDYTHFDVDPALFYYDAENKCSDVELLHKAEEVPEFVKTYAGAGIYKKLELSAK